MLSRRTIGILGVIAVCLAFASPATAEQVAKKWRISAAVGMFGADDEIPSASANILVLSNRQTFEPELAFVDPRNDSSVFNNLDIQPAPLATISAQYAVTDIFLIEASVGYQKGDLGDVEMQVQFDGAMIFPEFSFNFTPFQVPVGDVERVPLQLTALARFRPRANFNPYVGGGLGYAFIGFEPSAEFNELSINMDRSIGGQTRLSDALNAVPSLLPPDSSQFVDLVGASVDARDTFEWHLMGGAELSFKRNWVVFADLRFTVASRQLSVGFNGSSELGRSVPNLADFVDSPLSQATFGAVQISQGGLIDGGRLILMPVANAPAGTDCNLTPQFCTLRFDPTQPDGVVDPGLYYVQGGSVDYDGLSMLVGVRYTF